MRSRPPGSFEEKKGIRMESEHQKTYDLIPPMTYVVANNMKTCLINL